MALTQTQAINGLGGIGKTQIAVEYAYRYCDEYRCTFWMNSATRDTLLADFMRAAAFLDLPQKDNPDQGIVLSAVKRWLLQHDNWLLILDNADMPDILHDFLPAGNTGHILITTRAQAIGSLAHTLPVEKMDREEGTLLLLRRARVLGAEDSLSQADESDKTQAEAIVAAMDGLPLALDQAGAYIEETKCSLSDYLDLYGTHHMELLRRRSQFTTDHPEPVVTTWFLSFQKIEQANHASADLLRLCAFLDPDAIPEEILIEGAPDLGTNLIPLATDMRELNKAAEEVLRYSLIQRHMNTKTLSIHRLVQAVLRNRMSQKMQRQWAERTVRAVCRTFPEVEMVTWSRCQRLLPHAQACAELIHNFEFTFPEATQLLTKGGSYLLTRAQYMQAEALLLQALAIREQMLGPTHPDTASSLDYLGWLYQRQGKYKEAESLLLRALAIREQVLGLTHPDIVQSLSNLGDFYGRQGKYKEAESLLLRALAICEQALGPIHPDTASSLHHLGWLYSWYVKYQEAEPLFQRALAIDKQVRGLTHPGTAADLHALGWVYCKQARYKEAELLLQQALTIREQLLGSTHPDTVQSLTALGWIYWGQGRYNEAELLFHRVLAACEQLLGPVHPDTAQSLLCLGMVYSDQGRYQEAEPLCQRAIAIYEQVFGPASSDTAKALGVYALLLLKRWRIMKAVQIGVRVLKALGMRVTLLHITVMIRIYIKRVSAAFKIR